MISMKKDESNRILRMENNQNVLSAIKGKEYLEYREKWKQCSEQQIATDFPLQINVELVADCNLRCKMCYRSYDEIQKRKGYLEIANIRQIAKQAKTMKIPSIWITGGEPLLHPYFDEAMQIFKEVESLDFWIVTNGLLLTEEKASTLIKSGVTWLSISIDAYETSTYKNIRGGELEVVKANIKNFIELKKKMNSKLPLLRVSFIKMQDNYAELDKFIDEWKDIADMIDIQTLANYRDLDDISDELALENGFKCTAPFTIISILSNGDILPCCNGFYNEKSLYNLNNILLDEYWKSDYHQALAENIKNKRYDQECMKCVKSFMGIEND